MEFKRFKEPKPDWKMMFANRLNRLNKLVQIGAPDVIIANEVTLLAKCFCEDVNSEPVLLSHTN